MLYTIYSAQRGQLRTTALFSQCPNCRAALWDRPEYWSHITNDQKVFNVPETWVWAAILLGKLRKVSHMAWVCVLTFEAEQGMQGLEALPSPCELPTCQSAHPRLQQMLRAQTAGASTLEGTRPPVPPVPARPQGVVLKENPDWPKLPAGTAPKEDSPRSDVQPKGSRRLTAAPSNPSSRSQGWSQGTLKGTWGASLGGGTHHRGEAWRPLRRILVPGTALTGVVLVPTPP
eukprot:5590095-Amphidinium_carterae.1